MDSPRDSATSPEGDVLESLTLFGKPEGLPRMTGSTNKQMIEKVSYTHQDMADFILANPAVSQNDLALRYGYRPHTISVIKNSDAFQVYLATRRAEIVDPVLTATVEDRMRAVTVRSLEVLQEKLEMPAHQVSDELALRAAQMGSKALGMGIAAAPPPPPTSNLIDLAERLTSLVRRPANQGVVDVQAREVP